ncbi:MAG: hypothetical protein ACI9CF_001339 [Candidatus Omnitrophota bacterium]|jgi:hypothetical protein
MSLKALLIFIGLSALGYGVFKKYGHKKRKRSTQLLKSLRTIGKGTASFLDELTISFSKGYHGTSKA